MKNVIQTSEVSIKCNEDNFMPKFEILLSCLNSDVMEIIRNSQIKSDVLAVNQCDNDSFLHFSNDCCNVKIYNVNDRGLTKSRNFAIKHSAADICLLCDDDEKFRKGYQRKICRAYEKIKDADVIIFDIGNRPARFPKKVRRLGYFDLFKVSSWQISFRRKSLLSKGILFDENMGAGTPNGAEEELRFLTDCRKAGLNIYYVPAVIADVAQEKSTWFTGFDKTFFVNRGNTTRYIMGLPLSVLYAFYYAFAKRKNFGENMGFFKAFYYMCLGIKENRLKKLKEKQHG